jgi:hypothetical protein
VVLSWTPGEGVAAANGHIIYVSANFNDVNNGIGGVTLSTSSYDPGRLDFGMTYYWRVDEVGTAPGAAAFKGEVWSFTVEPVFIRSRTTASLSRSRTWGPRTPSTVPASMPTTSTDGRQADVVEHR